MTTIFRPASLLRLCALMLAISTMMFTAGCSTFYTKAYKITGNQVFRFGEKEMVPYLLAYDDTNMACAAGVALTPLLMSFEAVGADPNQLAIMVYTAAGLCAENEGLEQELRYLRAAQQQNIPEAQDARIAQKRWHALAATRQYVGYQRFVAHYGEMPKGRCPKNLDSDFDQLMYLVGILAGVQAVLNDSMSEQAVGVPRDIAAKVERMAVCVNSAKWWGLPQGLRAALWSIMPMLAPEGAKPRETLAQVAKQGERSGVRLGHAIWALVAVGDGDVELTKNIIRDFANAGRTAKLDPNFKMLDAMAAQMILAVSDRLWTEATGTRTPMGGLGTFWDDKPKSAGNIDDLL